MLFPALSGLKGPFYKSLAPHLNGLGVLEHSMLQYASACLALLMLI